MGSAGRIGICWGALRLGAPPFALATCFILWPGHPVLAQGRGELLSVAPTSPERIDALGRDVERAESLRQIKNLQILYTQFAEFGLWDEIGGLLSDDVELVS